MSRRSILTAAAAGSAAVLLGTGRASACSICYRYTWYRPYECIRIYHPVWIYNVSC